MISKKMNPLVQNNSVIRVMFEEGKRLAAIYGAENVYDFSLGNPNVPAPQEVEDSILETLKEEESTFIHGYMSNSGYEDVRETIAQRFKPTFRHKISSGKYPDDRRCCQWFEYHLKDHPGSGR